MLIRLTVIGERSQGIKVKGRFDGRIWAWEGKEHLCFWHQDPFELSDAQARCLFVALEYYNQGTKTIV